MARITVDLVRRRAEHNHCEIATLEELSLHQQDLVKIEHLDRWCKGLKILYLQNNLIARIENVGRLKQLQYLNLALNNIEKVENLQNCEFLDKLDLTLNFIGDILSVESLSANAHLRELYLTGNPCTDYEGYRDFVVAVLPQITSLDGTEVTKSERILATQRVEEIRGEIVKQQEEHKEKRAREKADHERRQAKKNEKKPGFDGRWYTDPNAHLAKNGDAIGKNTDAIGKNEDTGDNGGDGEAKDDEFWNDEDIPYTPESRTETLLHIADNKKEKPKEPTGPEQVKRVRKLEMDGKMLNVNEGRYEFHLTESEDENSFVLDVAIPRFMDTSLVDCDVQPTYVRVTIKGKMLQLVLQEEVSPDRSSAKRSQTTGHLVITMPKAVQIIRPSKHTQPHKPVQSGHTSSSKPTSKESTTSTTKSTASNPTTDASKPTSSLLEVDPSVRVGADFANIVKDKENEPPSSCETNTTQNESKEVTVREVSDDFIDDPDVPPLI